MLRSSFAKNIGSNWILLAMNVAISFVLSPFVVNKLGSVYYGIWAIAMQFTGYLYLMDFGVRESVIRYTSKYAVRQQARSLNQVLSASLLLYLPITIGCILLALLCAWLAPSIFDIPETHVTETRLAVIFVGLTIAQTFVFNVFTGIQHGLNRFFISNVTGMAMTILRTVLIVVMLSLGYKLVALAAIQFGVAILGGIICMWQAIRSLRLAGTPLKLELPGRRRFTALRRKILGYGFYVLVNNIAQKINFTSDAIVIGIFLPVSSVTPYAIAGSLVDYLRSLIMSTAQIFNPLSSALYTQRRPEDLIRLLIRGSKLTVVVTSPIALTYAILGDTFVGLWMGPEYAASAGAVLLVLGITQLVSAPHYVVASVLYGMSKHRAMGFLRVGEAAANLTLSIILVQKMGIVGVALGTAISHFVVVLALLPSLIKQLVGVSITRYFMGTYARALVASIPFALGAFWIRLNWQARNLLEFFAQVAVLCILYGLSVLAIGLDKEERQTMLKPLTRRLAKDSA